MDKLFLLGPAFNDSRLKPEGRNYFCPACASVEGMLNYFPAIRDHVETIYVGFDRPRQPLANLLGEANQGCPLLIVDTSARPAPASARRANGYFFFSGSKEIQQYLAETHQVSWPHP